MPGQQDAVGEVVLAEEVGDLGQAGRAGGAVDEGDAVEEDRRGEGAEDEVLHGRLARLGPAAVEAGQHVQGDREDLEAEEDHDQVVGRGHEHGARRREQGQHVELGPVEALPPQVAVGDQRAEDDGAADQDHEEDAEAVDRDGVADGEGRRAWGRAGSTARPTRRAPPRPTSDGQGRPTGPGRDRLGITDETTRMTSAPPIRISSGRMVWYSTGMCSSRLVQMPWTPPGGRTPAGTVVAGGLASGPADQRADHGVASPRPEPQRADDVGAGSGPSTSSPGPTAIDRAEPAGGT